MEDSLVAIFDEIWPMTMYYLVQGLRPDFGATLRIHAKSIFDLSSLKISMQHKVYVHQKML